MKEWVIMIVVAVAIAFVVNEFLIVNAKIPSGSMENTIMTGDRVLGSRLVYKMHDPERFDIVVFHYPDDEKQLFIKRIIGLPGETVDIVDGKVYIDGAEEPLDDSFIKDGITGNFTGSFQVPENCYFMLGDNRTNSKDSRYWNNHYVQKNKILGKAYVRYWPIWKAGLIK